MRVKYIDNDGLKYDLTIGKSYEVFNKTEYYYEVIDDNGIRGYYPKEWFKLLSELRNEKIERLLDE